MPRMRVLIFVFGLSSELFGYMSTMKQFYLKSEPYLALTFLKDDFCERWLLLGDYLADSKSLSEMVFGNLLSKDARRILSGLKR